MYQSSTSLSCRSASLETHTHIAHSEYKRLTGSVLIVLCVIDTEHRLHVDCVGIYMSLGIDYENERNKS